ncbi:UNVERIFIED_CONTAM: hypothetical protein FKN15_057694 [Acipenser sinensis]
MAFFKTKYKTKAPRHKVYEMGSNIFPLNWPQGKQRRSDTSFKRQYQAAE